MTDRVKQFLFIDLFLILPIAIFSEFRHGLGFGFLLTGLQWVGQERTLLFLGKSQRRVWSPEKS